MEISDSAIVLREYAHEDNRILTLLSKKLGVITAFANNATKAKSKMANSTELLCYSDFILFKSKDRYFVNTADSSYIFFGIRSDFEDLSLASYFAQLFSHLAPQEEEAAVFVELLLTSLYNLEGKKRPHLLIKPTTELRLLALSGYMPDLVGCKVCGSYEHKKMYFSNNGELVCGSCYNVSLKEIFFLLPSSVLAAMRHIIYSNSKKIFAFTLSDSNLTILASVCENYLLHQIERTLPTLDYYKNITFSAI